MSVSTEKSSDFTPDISKNLTSFCMSGKETLITNKFGCWNKANISLSVNIYLITGVSHYTCRYCTLSARWLLILRSFLLWQFKQNTFELNIINTPVPLCIMGCSWLRLLERRLRVSVVRNVQVRAPVSKYNNISTIYLLLYISEAT